MAMLMFLLLLILLIFSFVGGKGKFLSPWFLLCAVTTVSFTIVLANYTNWEVKVNFKFVLYITTALIAFGFGTLIISLKYKKSATNIKALPLCQIEYNRYYPANFLIIASVIFAVAYIGKLFSDAYNPAFSFSQTLRQIYEIRNEENYSPGFIFNQFSEIVMAIAYINTFRLFIKMFSGKDKISFLKLIIPILVFLITALISTDRNIFLRYGIFFICLWMFFYYNNSKSKNTNKRIILGLCIIVAVILLLFYIMGKLKNYTSIFTDSLSIYGGSGLNNFNIWLEEFDGNYLYGQATFTQLITTIGSLLKPLGIELQGKVDRVDPFINYFSHNGYYYSSNIYTALRPFVEDFGYCGVLFFPFIMGLFYQWLYIRAKKDKYSFKWILYCLLIYPIIFFPILEQLFKRFHFGFIYEIVWPFIIYSLVYRKKKFKLRQGIIGNRGVVNGK